MYTEESKIAKWLASLDHAPADKEVHAWAEKEGVNIHKLEAEIYALAKKHVDMGHVKEGIFKSKKRVKYLTPEQIQKTVKYKMKVHIIRGKQFTSNQDGYVLSVSPYSVYVQIIDKLGSDFKRELRYDDFTGKRGFYIDGDTLILNELG